MNQCLEKPHWAPRGTAAYYLGKGMKTSDFVLKTTRKQIQVNVVASP